METFSNVIDSATKCKVSTVLNNNTADFGKQNMFDGLSDTSWYSDQGKFQKKERYIEKVFNIIFSYSFCINSYYGCNITKKEN